MMSRRTRWFGQFLGWLSMACVLAIANPGVLSGQAGAFSGTVLIDPTEKPLANAEIVFTALNRSVRSDSAGNFLFSGLPLGKHAVVVKMLGYESINVDITLTGAKPVEVDLLLKPTVTKLDKVEVKALSHNAARLAEFEGRRTGAPGKYLTGDYFAQNEGRPISSFLLEKLAGVKIVQANGRHWLASLRGSARAPTCDPKFDKLCINRESVPAACYMQIVINGIIRFQDVNRDQLFDIDQLNARDIIGFEFHSIATTPLQYNMSRGTSGSCGTIIIWTKAGG